MIIHHLLSDQRKSPFKDFIERVYIKTADKIVTVSNTTHKILLEKKIINKDIDIIEPGLDILPEKEIRIKTNDIFKILFIGTIEKRKGLNLLIEALHILQFNKFELTVIGNIKTYNYYSEILSLIEKYSLKQNIIFLQNLSNEDLIKKYSESDCLVFPTLWEGYGMVVTEAMACGLPIIASDIPSIRELMSEGKHGYLVEPSRPDLIADKLNILFNNPELRKRMAINCIEKAKHFKNWNEISKLHYELLEKFRKQ
jgi:glycosyltransferase involved in cell wall biosynthesis